MKHPARKRWGQNFLTDPNTCRKIVQLLRLKPDDQVVEIGPGLGALTTELTRQSNSLTAIEIDPLCCSHLEKLRLSGLNIVNQDFLYYDLDSINSSFKIIGNLPYYITTPILFKVLENKNWVKAVFMVQKEVVERITAKPGSRIYGRLTVMAALYCSVKKELTVPAHLFKPKPQVDSAVISIIPNPMPKIILDNFNPFKKMIAAAFSSRRKVLRNTLEDYLTQESLERYGKLRPEQLSVDDFKNIFTVWKDFVD